MRPFEFLHLTALRRLLAAPARRRARCERERIEALLRPLNVRGQPNLNALTLATSNLDAMALNVKAMGYELARTLAAALPPPDGGGPRHIGLTSGLATQGALESGWARHWLGELGVPLIFHRKLWEIVFVLQALHEEGLLAGGRRGLGFGCGGEPVASYLARLDISALITDLPADDARVGGWRATNQHVASLDQAFHPHLVDRDRFERHVAFRAMDMNAIDPDLAGFDFCWSMCALEHLGSIDRGLDFIEESLRPLRPGGLAVHTTELNLDTQGPTVDNWLTVLFQRRHFARLAERLRRRGHHLVPIDYDPGDRPLDRFIDVPPWYDDRLAPTDRDPLPPQHLKVAMEGFVATSIGLIIRKAG